MAYYKDAFDLNCNDLNHSDFEWFKLGHDG